VLCNGQKNEPSMIDVTTLWIEMGKSVLQLNGRGSKGARARQTRLDMRLMQPIGVTGKMKRGKPDGEAGADWLCQISSGKIPEQTAIALANRMARTA
jgi:hypothetical protein